MNDAVDVFVMAMGKIALVVGIIATMIVLGERLLRWMDRTGRL